MSTMQESPVEGWDAVDDPWNYGKLKSADRKSTILVKEISLADGGSAFRVDLYDAPNPYDMDGDHVDEDGQTRLEDWDWRALP